ncbi:hypothetical protein MTO96_009547 [Rhipicephalus appendiculatus]
MTLEDERMMDHEAELEAAINLSTGQTTAAVRASSATPTTNGVAHEDDITAQTPLGTNSSSSSWSSKARSCSSSTDSTAALPRPTEELLSPLRTHPPAAARGRRAANRGDSSSSCSSSSWRSSSTRSCSSCRYRTDSTCSGCRRSSCRRP